MSSYTPLTTKPNQGSSINPLNKLIPAGSEPTTATFLVLQPILRNKPEPMRMENLQITKPITTIKYH